jgi:7-carboxy-7-deazaguanine synthase
MAHDSTHPSSEKLVINEIFHSIQGESSHAGRPCTFIRLSYCNIRCSYCDTPYAFNDGVEMTIADILERIKTYRCRLVEVTGGEPLFQEGVHTLLTCLCDYGYEVLLETGGTIDIGDVDSRVKRIVDFKCPSSNMMKKNEWKNIDYLRPTDEVKFVIGTREDYDWAKSMISNYGIQSRSPVLMSVVFGVLEPLQLCEWILEDRLDVRFQLQSHKYIWSPETRGV